MKSKDKKTDNEKQSKKGKYDITVKINGTFTDAIQAMIPEQKQLKKKD